MNNKIMLYRSLTLAGYFGLQALLYLQLFWLNPPAPQLMVPALLFHIGPLMFPVRGLLSGRAYTHAWAAYLALFYFIIGVWYGAAEAERLIGIAITLASIVFFVGAILYARYKGKADKAALEASQA